MSISAKFPTFSVLVMVTPAPLVAVMLPNWAEASDTPTVAVAFESDAVSVAVIVTLPVGAVVPPTTMLPIAPPSPVVAGVVEVLTTVTEPVAVRFTVVPPSIVVALIALTVGTDKVPTGEFADASVFVTVVAAVEAAVMTSAPVDALMFNAVSPVQPDASMVSAPTAVTFAV
jgi:hypothetical protein